MLQALVLLGVSGAIAAPTPTTVGANVNVSQRNGNQTEAAIAIDPSNTQRVFIASNDESQNLSGLFTARSTDGGTTWTAQNVGTGAGGDGFVAACCDPTVAWDGFGNLFFGYLSTAGGTRNVILLNSTDGGQNWTNVATIATGANLDQPTVAVGANMVWVTWRISTATGIGVRGANVTGLGTIGAFTAAETLTNSAGGNYGDITIGPGGEVVAGYQIPQTGQGPATLFTHIDADGTGAGTFGARRQLAVTNVGGFDFIPAQADRSVDAELGLAYDRTGGANDGRLYAVYTDEATDENNDMDITFRFSDDDGANWSAATQVNDDAGTNSQFLPKIAVDQSNGNVAVSFHDARNDGAADADGANNDAQLWGAISTNAGASFNPNVQISTGTSDEDGAEPPAACCADIDYGDYIGLAFAGGRMMPAWADNSNSTGNNPAGTGVTMDIYTALVTPPQPNRPPVVDAGPPVTGTEGLPIALSGTVTDPDDPSPTISWSYAPLSGVDAGATCSFASPSSPATTITCTDDGVYTATLTANDGFAPPVSDSTTVTVLNAPPSLTITGPPGGSLYAVNTAVSLTSTFTDQGSNDTHTCSIAWDDGTTSTFAAVGGACNQTHTFTGAGVYTIVVTVTDDDGGSDSESVMVVVYDPSAGFVTGGGWIESPAGAYAADPTMTGKATFGFVSKYVKGATVPTGQTEFVFHAAGFNFHSESYQWLVVAGPKAQYKGTGTVNGVSGYGFLLTATDGAQLGGGGVDKFRIKIWSLATNAVVYDNVAGAGEDIDVANPQALDAGNIVIHKGK